MIQLSGMKIFAKMNCKTTIRGFARKGAEKKRDNPPIADFRGEGRARYLETQSFVADETTKPREYRVRERDEGYESHDVGDYAQNDGQRSQRTVGSGVQNAGVRSKYQCHVKCHSYGRREDKRRKLSHLRLLELDVVELGETLLGLRIKELRVA